MLYKIFLPKPSSSLIDLTRHYALAEPIDALALDWHKKIQNPTVNCAAGSFFMKSEITDIVKQEYQKFFTKEIFPIIGVMTNTVKNLPASYPPHSDRVRTVGINYYIDLGGDNVQTIFYDKHDPLTDKIGGHVEPYENLKSLSTIKFTKDIWYAIDTRHYHSVENIMTKRYLLSLSFIDTDYAELVTLMPSIQIKKIETTNC